MQQKAYYGCIFFISMAFLCWCIVFVVSAFEHGFTWFRKYVIFAGLPFELKLWLFEGHIGFVPQLAEGAKVDAFNTVPVLKFIGSILTHKGIQFYVQDLSDFFCGVSLYTSQVFLTDICGGMSWVQYGSLLFLFTTMASMLLMIISVIYFHLFFKRYSRGRIRIVYLKESALFMSVSTILQFFGFLLYTLSVIPIFWYSFGDSLPWSFGTGADPGFALCWYLALFANIFTLCAAIILNKSETEHLQFRSFLSHDDGEEDIDHMEQLNADDHKFGSGPIQYAPNSHERINKMEGVLRAVAQTPNNYAGQLAGQTINADKPVNYETLKHELQFKSKHQQVAAMALKQKKLN